MSLRAYAKRRGVDPKTVSDAAAADRLKLCIVRAPPDALSPRGRVLGITDPWLADKEWAENTDVSKAPAKEQAKAAQREALLSGNPEALTSPPGASLPEDGELTLANASAQDKFWAAAKKRLEYRQAAGELVEAKDVEHRLVDVFTACKTRLLAIPSRARQALPELTAAQVAALEGLIREALEDLAGPRTEKNGTAH